MARVQRDILEAPICEAVLQIQDTGSPKPRYLRGPDQFLLADTKENVRPLAQT